MTRKLQMSFQDDLVELFTETDLCTACLNCLAQALQVVH